MKVILLQKVAGLGNPDQVKEVAEGYARNFLFPRHLAVPASGQAVQELEARGKRKVKEAEQDLRHQQELAEKTDGLEVEVKEKANKENVLYAAVGPAKVSGALKAMGFDVPAEQIIMKPIKGVGTFPAKLKFKHGLEADVEVIVTATQ